MQKIVTRPKEIEQNVRVLYTGNHYISLPEIHNANASIMSLNIISLFNKGLIELAGNDVLFKPKFFKNGNELKIKRAIVKTESYYIPFYHLMLEGGIAVRVKIYADFKEKGFIYQFETTDKLEIKLQCNIDKLNILRFNTHPVEFKKALTTDKWLGNPVISILANNIALALAFGGEKEISSEYSENGNLLLNLICEGKNCFYITANSDSDGASATLVHLKRKGYQNIYSEFKTWLESKFIKYEADPKLERRLNQNLFFNYFFAVGKAFDTDDLIALTSRSPRYYVSAAFWERDSFLWSFPAIKIIDKELYLQLAREMILRHSKNTGDHAHYIDGTVLYPGFELDEAASYFLLLEDFSEIDETLLKALEVIFKRIEQELDVKTGLYKTFLLPSDDPAEYPLVTFDNVLLWKGFKNLRTVYQQLGQGEMVELLSKRIKAIAEGINTYLIKDIGEKRMFVWAIDLEGNYLLYNDPPGNLGLLSFYGFVDHQDPIFRNTIDYYYSKKYPYYFNEVKIKELACEHHPNTPSGLGLCASILNPLKSDEAIGWLKEAKMDHGLLSESFDGGTGEAKTGVGFATGSGYLAYALYKVLIEGTKLERGKDESSLSNF